MILYARRTYVNQILLLVLDVLVIFGVFRLINYIQRGDWQFEGNYPLFFAVFALLWWVLAGHFVSTVPLDRLTTYWEKFWGLVRTFLLHAIFLTIGMIVLQVHLLPMRYLALTYCAAATVMISGRLFLTFLYRTYRYRLAQPHSRFVIVGTSRSGYDLHRFLTMHDPLANQCLGFFAEGQVSEELQPLVRGNLADLKQFCVQEKVDEIYFAMPLDQTDLIQELSSFADDNFITFRIVPDFEGTLHKGINVHYHSHGPILTVRRHPLGLRANQVVKRLFDLAFSGFVIVTIFPIIMPILALLIKLDSPGPVFFKQLRPGKRNQLFPCYKLRTMRTDLGGIELQATKGDARITRFGRFLRSSSLDELPQFFNVWMGHMSVVGPRPNMVSQLEEYSKHISTYAQRHAVTPGITGYAQVNGYRGETRAEGAMEKRVEYDLKYVENWSLLLDLQIIARTVRNMIVGEKNAY
jgi:putative colanic acid biosynthesis UDP-glucose lipid carrier transferase